jgi:predicted small lipoprotein YifL
LEQFGCFTGQLLLRIVNRVHMRKRLQLGLAVALSLLAAFGLACCGVRGSLEAPPQAKTETGSATPGTPGQPTPHKSSILDPLIR